MRKKAKFFGTLLTMHVLLQWTNAASMKVVRGTRQQSACFNTVCIKKVLKCGLKRERALRDVCFWWSAALRNLNGKFDGELWMSRSRSLFLLQKSVVRHSLDTMISKLFPVTGAWRSHDCSS